MLTNINDVKGRYVLPATQKYRKSEAQKQRSNPSFLFNLTGTLFARYLVPFYFVIDIGKSSLTGVSGFT